MTIDNAKKQWVLDYMANPIHNDEFIDITAESFVDAYIEEFNPKTIEYYMYGAPKVLEINRVLGELYKEGRLRRYRHYCEQYQDGYPRWFYTYNLKEQ